MENEQSVQPPIFSSFGMSLSLLNLNKQKALRQICRTSKLLSEVEIETNLIKKSITNRLETFKAREKSIDQQTKTMMATEGCQRSSRRVEEGSINANPKLNREEEIAKALQRLDRRKTDPSHCSPQTFAAKNPFAKASNSKLTFPLFEKPAHFEHSSDKRAALCGAGLLPACAKDSRSNSKSAFFGLSKRTLPFEVFAAARTLAEDPKKLAACKKLQQPDAGAPLGLSSVRKLRGIINYDRMLGRPALRRLSVPESPKAASRDEALQESRRETQQIDLTAEQPPVQDFTFRKVEDSKIQASHSSLNSIRDRPASQSHQRKRISNAAKLSPFALQLGRQARRKKHSSRDSKLPPGDVCYNLVRQASPSIKIKTGDYFGPCRVTVTAPKISKPHFIITRKLHP